MRNCDDLEVAYHLTYERKDMSLDETPQLIPVNLVHFDGSPVFTGHYMVDLVPLSDDSARRVKHSLAFGILFPPTSDALTSR